jgi:succinoglycan biosynthesis transport protein ExoP
MIPEETRLPSAYRASGLQMPQRAADAFTRYSAGLVDARDNNTNGSANRDNILAFIHILLRHKALLLLGTVVGAAVAAAYVLGQVPVYEARTSLELQGVNEDFLDMRKVDPTAGKYAGDTYVQTQIKLLQSNALTRSVVKMLQETPVQSKNVKGDAIQVPAPLGAVRSLVGLSPEIPVSQAEALKLAADTVKIRGSGMTRIVEVYVQTTWPELAAKFTNTLADQYIEQNLQARWQTAQDTTMWLSRQLDDLKVKLEQSEQRLQASAHGAQMTFTEQGNLGEAKLRQIQTDLMNAQADRMVKQSAFELAQAKANSPDELPEVLGDPMLRDYQSKLTELRRQLADQSAAFTDEHPNVVRLRLQLQTLQTARDRELKNVLKRIETEFQTATRREALLSNAYDQQATLVGEQAGKAIEYNVAKREVDTIRSLYDTMLQKVREAGIAAAMRRSDARVVDYALTPEKPIRPSVPIFLAMGMFGGFSFCMVFVVARERSKRAFTAPGDTSDFLGLPELGIIPSVNVDPAMTNRKRLLQRGEDGMLTSVQPRALELAAWNEGPCLTSESFHAALVSINFASNGSSSRRVLLVTSADPSEGKTFSAVNLAVASAKRGDRVLLIDADMRRPRVHDIFGVSNATGLGTILEGTALPESSQLLQIIQPTAIAGLSLLPSGDTGTDIARLLHTPMMQSLIDWAREHYDVILLDTPPMLQVSDARIMGRYVDAVIFAIRAGQTQRDKARAALRKFAQDGTVVLGTILTDWNPSRNAGASSYYHNYTSYYHKAKR